jgi:hypothetical protein
MNANGPTPTIAVAAQSAYAAGLCIVPPKEDGSKMPIGPWKDYQKVRPSQEQVTAWYANGRSGLGIVTGHVSGDLELFEFEGRAVEEGLLSDYEKAAQESGLGPLLERVRLGWTDRSPTGGPHYHWRCPDGIEGNLELAKRPATNEELALRPQDPIKVLIETRGEGGFVVIAPSNGKVHPSGRPWKRIAGHFHEVAVISGAERKALLDLARAFDRMPRVTSEPVQVANDTSHLPGSDFESRTSWPEILQPHGWTKGFTTRDGNEHWMRPGKELQPGQTFGTSATINESGTGILYLFSSATPFDSKKGYGKFGAYTVLNHGGDFSAASADLYEKGFGERKPEIRGAEKAEEAGIASPFSANSAYSAPQASWPESLKEEAFYGLAGRITRAIEPHTEADTAAVLIQLLVGFGNLIGRTAHFMAGADQHYTNLFAVLVADTSKGRKGTSWGRVRQPLGQVDLAWAANRIMGGLSSGEGLVHEVRDDIEKVVKGETVVEAGEADKRLLVVESEFASVLKQASRQGNILSATMRQCWDTGFLRNLVVMNPRRATNAHVSILGQVTRSELLRLITETEAANGFGNRFLWICARRSKSLPDGGGHPDLLGAVQEMQAAARFAQRTELVQRDDDAREFWHIAYGPLSEGKPGLLGAMIARAEAQVMRLALIYAMLDQSDVIGLPHLEAALAVWQYCEDSARYIFGSLLGDPTADTILTALRAAPDGLTRTQIANDVLGKHKPSGEISRALAALVGQRLAAPETIETGGRPSEIWRAVK